MTENSPDKSSASESTQDLPETNTETPASMAPVVPDSGSFDEADGATVAPLIELPGERLAAKRREMRWSVDEAARMLKLAPRQIDALEANDFAALPGMATVRGFIRSYAKLLELEPEPLLKLIAGEPNPAFDAVVLRRPLPSAGFSGRRYASSAGSHRAAARNMFGLAVLVLIFLLIVAFSANRMGWLPLPFGLGLAGDGATTDAPVAEPVAGQFNTAPALAEIVPPQRSVDPANALEIDLRQDSWVEINTQNGDKLVSRLMKAGTTESFDIKEPVVLVVGNASGVEARLRGEVLNLRSVARDNVSKLSLK